ncbi:ArsC/Spx/MgsR family protein [Rhodovulum steppense]|jgi:nitrogenase-associated protein|uniref:Nitrogenase-associated protein n=1 Tax=Rhodovulum steppense TaxID=540251 RepID=A0A4R1YST4_9RHOB|nr:ArsC/Spx/MgsR family protein [Rhodovulum steppense]TCM82719.1 nitrogenase-associated protein [Rhodovulum steppense]
MARITFFEKPGCIGNARQRALLAASGHDLDTRDILHEPWTVERLRPFFGDRPVRDWFNQSAPRVKSGEVQPDALTAEEALGLMVRDPLLIRRPLMQVGCERMAGFEQEKVEAWIGLRPTNRPVTDDCPRFEPGRR